MLLTCVWRNKFDLDPATHIREPIDYKQCTDKERNFILLYKSSQAPKIIKYLFLNNILLIGHLLMTEHMTSINNNKPSDPCDMKQLIKYMFLTGFCVAHWPHKAFR